MDANGVSGGWGGLENTGDGYTPKLAPEEYDKISAQWRQDTSMWQAGVQLLANVFQAATNEKNPDSKQLQLSNLNRVVYEGMDAGRKLLQRAGAYYQENQEKVIQVGQDVDLLNEYANQTTLAYQEKRSDDFSYTEEIAAYWGYRDIAEDIIEETKDVWKDVKEGAGAIAKEAQKFSWPVALGLVAVALIVWVKK